MRCEWGPLFAPSASKIDVGPIPCTLVVQLTSGRGAVLRRKFTVDRCEEIQWLLTVGRGIRKITLALKWSRRLAWQLRYGLRDSPDQPKNSA